MQCRCGGDAKLISQGKKNLNAVLHYYQCERCRLVSGGELTIDHFLVASDSGGVPSARLAFTSLTKESAASLVKDLSPEQAPAQQALF